MSSLVENQKHGHKKLAELRTSRAEKNCVYEYRKAHCEIFVSSFSCLQHIIDLESSLVGQYEKQNINTAIIDEMDQTHWLLARTSGLVLLAPQPKVNVNMNCFYIGSLMGKERRCSVDEAVF